MVLPEHFDIHVEEEKKLVEQVNNVTVIEYTIRQTFKNAMLLSYNT